MASPFLGEFAFVALGIAERSGLIAPQLCKMLLTTVALSMAATPMLAEAGTYISMKIEKEKGITSEHIGQYTICNGFFFLQFTACCILVNRRFTLFSECLLLFSKLM